MSFKLKTLVLLLFVMTKLSAQDNSTDSIVNLKKDRSAYIGITFGTGPSSLRDFATSPLIYTSFPKYLAGSFMRVNEYKETEIRFSSISDSYNIKVGNENSTSDVDIFNIYYSRLYRFDKIGNDKWHFKLGGLYQLTFDMRNNKAFGNFAQGFDFFSTFFGSVKFFKDVSRTSTKNKKFLFIKYKLNPRKRNLAFRLNIGLINSTYRNAYAYRGLSGVLNDPKLFDNYEFNLFSGYRMNTELDYTIYLKNKNAIQFSYIWDAYKTGGDFDALEMAIHTFKMSFLFNTNNK